MKDTDATEAFDEDDDGDNAATWAADGGVCKGDDKPPDDFVGGVDDERDDDDGVADGAFTPLTLADDEVIPLEPDWVETIKCSFFVSSCVMVLLACLSLT